MQYNGSTDKTSNNGNRASSNILRSKDMFTYLMMYWIAVSHFQIYKTAYT